jgi:hypothetical protein
VPGCNAIVCRVLSFSAFRHPGVWQVAFVVLTERAGAQQYAYSRDLVRAGFRASFMVRDRGVDKEPPRVFGLDVLPAVGETQTHILANERAVDIHGAAFDVGAAVNFTVDRALVVRVHIVDDRAGLYREQRDTDPFQLSYIHVESGAAPQKAGQTVYVPIRPAAPQLVGGDALNGVYEVRVPLPQHAWPGEWRIVELSLTDEAGNTRKLSTHALAALGWPTAATVRSFNLTFRGEDPYDYAYFEYWHPDNQEEEE